MPTVGSPSRHRTSGGLHRRVAEAVTRTRTRIGNIDAALVAHPAQKLVNPGLHRDLDQQARTQPRHILDDLSQIPAGTEQHIQLPADPVRG